jgi:glycosyltransferase involved in cell wall biosynthesis
MAATDSIEQPGLAIVANCMTPYRAHLHALIAARIPEFKLHTLITHGAAEFNWKYDVPDSIHATYFAGQNDSALASSLNAKTWWPEWQKGGRILQYLKDNNVHAVILNGYRYPSYLRVISSCHRQRLPLFGRNDSNIKCERFLPAWKAWLKARVYRWWIMRTSGVMSMGEYGDQFFLQYGADPARLYRVSCLPDLEYFARGNPEQLAGFRQKYGLSEDRRYLLYAGRLAPIKRVDLLLNAFASIADERPEWDLLIVGDGIAGAELRESVPERLRPRVIWTGFQEFDGCVAAYHAADVLVLPSDREPWAVVVQEAMAAGLTIIASDIVGAARDLVEDKVTGRIFPAGDLNALTQAIREVTGEPDTANRRAKVQAGLAEWVRRCDPVAGVRQALVETGVLPQDAG